MLKQNLLSGCEYDTESPSTTLEGGADTADPVAASTDPVAVCKDIPDKKSQE